MAFRNTTTASPAHAYKLAALEKREIVQRATISKGILIKKSQRAPATREIIVAFDVSLILNYLPLLPMRL